MLRSKTEFVLAEKVMTKIFLRCFARADQKDGNFQDNTNDMALL
jgi:hypothetical protein